jgi:hypothetical protein
VNERLERVLGRILKGRITKDRKAWPPICLERERSTPRIWGQTLRTVATGVKRCRLFSRTLPSEAQLGLSPCRTQAKVPLVTALALYPRSSAVARRFLCSRHDGSNHVEARRTQGSKECVPDPAAQNWVVWPTGHAGCRLTASPTDRGCRVSTPTTIFPLGLYIFLGIPFLLELGAALSSRLILF